MWGPQRVKSAQDTVKLLIKFAFFSDFTPFRTIIAMAQPNIGGGGGGSAHNWGGGGAGTPKEL